MLHAILVDGVIERIEGRPEFAEAEIEKRRKAGHASEYLFAARTEEEFEQEAKGNKGGDGTNKAAVTEAEHSP